MSSLDGVFGFVCKPLQKFDLGGHNLGTVVTTGAQRISNPLNAFR
jgi:hypothetical protein